MPVSARAYVRLFKCREDFLTVHAGVFVGAATIMVLICLCMPSRGCMTLAIAYFIGTEIMTVSMHIELSRCIQKSLLVYAALSGIVSSFFVLGLIVFFMYIIKHYGSLFLKPSPGSLSDYRAIEDGN